MSLQEEMREVQAKLERAQFERGFLRGLLAAVNEINKGGSIDEIKTRIGNVEIPQ